MKMQTELKFTHPQVASEELAFDAQTNTLTHYISTEAVNRYGYVLKNDGMRKKNYEKNNIVLYQHSNGGFFSNPKPSELVIGNGFNLRNDGKGILAETKFVDTELANETRDFYVNKSLRAWSVGWNFLTKEFRKQDDIFFLDEWDLLEYSAVIIPANPEAVTLMFENAKSETMKRQLTYSVALSEIETNLKAEFKNLLAQNQNNTDKKSINDFKAELNSKIQENKKISNQLFFDIINRLNNLERNLLNQLINKMPNIVEKAIRTFTGKVD